MRILTPPIDIRIGSRSQPPESIAVSPMNFGLFGHYTGGLAVHRYEIAIAAEDFVACLGDRVAGFIDDCKRDDARYGGLEVPCIVALGYPGVRTLLDNPACLAELVTGYLATETLWALLGDPAPGRPAYILHSLEALTVEPAGIHLSGAALKTVA